ncbi:hypothetical protein AMS68_001566 [Peltaster fructicola]|uniref:O-acyltransferase n=1 Tax=Peltaster fructicola TaxID=286661 RepID=A0A6H0XN49_9PEZI|nr:hypothetical protein AMS68_001566 [Peltaster fructicola]
MNLSRAVADGLKQPLSSPSSGRATPVPQDAPPSTKVISAARQELRQQEKKKRMFPTVTYESRVSYFDPQSDYSNFRGFFVLFWIGLSILALTSILRNLKETGWPFKISQWPLFTKDIYELALCDGLMAISIGASLPLHQLYRYGPRALRWNNAGVWIQSTFQLMWLVFWCSWPTWRDWAWTAQVFFTLHLLAMLMKMHSYAFYNGHLLTTYERLKQLDRPITSETPTTAAVRYPKVGEYPFHDKPEDGAAENISPIAQLREDLAMELTSPQGRVTYPQNLTVYNFWDYLLCPTLCYELEYPRTAGVNWMELIYKVVAVFGCIFLMTITTEDFILPVLDESAVELYRPNIGRVEQGLVFAETVSKLLFPFMVAFLLVFLVIFEYLLGAFAEITCFADRHFYSDWWNSADWLEFSRKWNRPVHLFLQRHVYTASRSIVSRPVATLITFLISAAAHELVMLCIARKWRGYGAFLMSLQVPLAAIQRLPWVRRRKLLNNVLFWTSMVVGPSLMCALYVLV